MNVRTNTMRVYNDCLIDDVARETGSDVMRISSGGSDPNCECAAWEGTLISLTGKTKGLPTYDQAKAGGCFHPNCTHTLEVVDEYADADEIRRAREHPFEHAEGGDIWEEQDNRKYEIDQAVYREQGMGAEEARVAVDRDNLAASIRAGLIREDADAVVARMTDAQVTALCRDGNPPEFEPFKPTKAELADGAKERWNHGKWGGVVHIAKGATAEDILRVCKVADAKDEPKTTAVEIPDFKTGKEGVAFIAEKIGVPCFGLEKMDPAFIRQAAKAIADAKKHLGADADKLQGVWTFEEYRRKLLAFQTKKETERLATIFNKKPDDPSVASIAERNAKKMLKLWNVSQSTQAYGRSRSWGSDMAQFNGIVLNNHLDRMGRTAEVKSGFKARGCENPVATVYHELGHIIDYQLGLTDQCRLPQNGVVMKLWNKSSEDIAKELSRYGAKNAREMIAEAWAEYKMNPSPRPLALAIGREIDRLCAERAKKNA